MFGFFKKEKKNKAQQLLAIARKKEKIFIDSHIIPNIILLCTDKAEKGLTSYTYLIGEEQSKYIDQILSILKQKGFNVSYEKKFGSPHDHLLIDWGKDIEEIDQLTEILRKNKI